MKIINYILSSNKRLGPLYSVKYFIFFTAVITILYPVYTSSVIGQVGEGGPQITFMDLLDRRSRSRIEEIKSKARPGG